MTYRGIVSNGVVVLDGEKPEDGTIVEVTTIDGKGTDLPSGDEGSVKLVDHPAIGIWKDRKDLPADSGEASKILRQRLMQRMDE